MRKKLSRSGQIEIPAKFRRVDKLRAGQKFEITRITSGEYKLKKVEPVDDFDLVGWLLSCPVKGWFREIPSDSMADI